MRPSHGVLFALLVTTTLGACTATIERQDAPALEARIVGSDLTTLKVQGPNRSEVTIDGHEIKEIDHPGNVLMTIGLVLTAITTFGLISSENKEVTEDSTSLVIAIAMPISLIISGFVPYFASTQAASAFDPTRISAILPDPVVPIPETSDDTTPTEPLSAEPTR